MVNGVFGANQVAAAVTRSQKGSKDTERIRLAIRHQSLQFQYQTNVSHAFARSIKKEWCFKSSSALQKMLAKYKLKLFNAC